MRVTASRALMALAVHSLGRVRPEWATAIEVEFEAASEDGKPLSFASGCLAAALRELPRRAEGRFAIASHLLAIAVILPAAGVLISSLVGFSTPYLESGQPILSEANRAAIPSLVLLLLCCATLQLRVAWLVLDRDWGRVAAIGAMSAAVAVTLCIFTAVVFGDHTVAVLQTTVVVAELTAVAGLARWHGQVARCHA